MRWLQNPVHKRWNTLIIQNMLYFRTEQGKKKGTDFLVLLLDEAGFFVKGKAKCYEHQNVH